MTLSQTFTKYSKLLKSSSPVLDVELLLAFTLKKSKEYLYTYPEKKLTTKQLYNFTTLFKRRLKGEPIAYILGHKEFYGLDFKVNKNVLIPRPETEQLVEEVINYCQSKIQNLKSKTSIIEIGIGSGALIISLAKSICHPACPPELQRRWELSRRMNKCLVPQYIGTDISAKALTVAKQNAKLHKVKIKFLQGNLLNPLKSKIQNLKSSILVANLPYLETKQLNNPQLNYEPRTALSGGPDGLKYYRELFQQIQKYKLQPEAIFLEIGHNQADRITELAMQVLPKYKITAKKDMCGFDRILIISK
jgi:release factor glutamine methyltransferase